MSNKSIDDYLPVFAILAYVVLLLVAAFGECWEPLLGMVAGERIAEWNHERRKNNKRIERWR